MVRMWAIIEREIWRFRRSPLLVFVTVFGPLLQLVILGYAFGGNLRGLRLALVDHDHGVPALRLRELANAVAANARTFEAVPYADEARALADLRAGKVAGVLTIPPGYSRRVLAKDDPVVGFAANNADRFVAATLAGGLRELLAASGGARADARRIATTPRLDVVEIYAYVPYVQFLLPGTIVLAIFSMVMIGGAFSFMDDKTLGLHEGYFVTPVTKLEMVSGFVISGAGKGLIAGAALMLVGMLVAGVPDPLAPLRLAKMLAVVALTSLALVGAMFMLVARVDNPMVPRIASQLLTTLLFFPSGAVYPVQAFPDWLRALATVNPFTYAVHALRGLLLQDVALGAVAGDLLVLAAFAVVTTAVAALAFKRTL